ncbi:MAG: DUF4115 domain-containing protein [Desulfobacterota bacterium]|nr:DUF4115 domain-containing protein [Thermodesulfobacteriota bacterium]MDW8001090.1 DUF4115 domain-containing protein [Deltaproteobacteria bacterium]
MNDFETLARWLKSRREEKGLTLEEVSERLCIRKHILEQIEAGKAEERIPFVYLSGYLKLYSRLLGCEEELREKISEILKERKEKPNPQEIIVKKPQRSFSAYKKYLIFVIVPLVFAFFFILEKDENTVPISKESVVERASLAESPSFDTTPFTEKKLVITCHERTWVSVVVDGKEKKEFMLNPKDVVVLNAKEGFDLLVGNAGGIRLILNGQDIGFSGRTGEVKRLRLY